MANDKKGINFYLRTRAYVHSPNALDEQCYPLYKRASHRFGEEALTDNEKDEVNELDKASKEKLWSSQIDGTFSSPRNIKRLFIGVNKFVVHYWAPIVKNGKLGSGLIETFSATTTVSDAEMITIIKSGGNIGNNIKVSNKRLGIDCFKDWALRNVEEIYFDWSALISADNSGAAGKLIKGIYKVKSEDTENFKNIFASRCTKGKTLESIDREYPRLKRVMFIRGLDALLDNTSFTGSGEDTVDKMKLDWFSSIDTSKVAGYIGFKGSNFGKVYDKFGMSLNVYEFDQLYLRDTFNKLSIKIHKYEEEQRVAQFKKDEYVNTDKGEFEIYLDKLYEAAKASGKDEKSANEYVINTLTTLGTLDIDTFMNNIASLTSRGQDKYMGIIEKSCSRMPKEIQAIIKGESKG